LEVLTVQFNLKCLNQPNINPGLALTDHTLNLTLTLTLTITLTVILTLTLTLILTLILI